MTDKVFSLAITAKNTDGMRSLRNRPYGSIHNPIRNNTMTLQAMQRLKLDSFDNLCPAIRVHREGLNLQGVKGHSGLSS